MRRETSPDLRHDEGGGTAHVRHAGLGLRASPASGLARRLVVRVGRHLGAQTTSTLQ